MKTSRLRSRNRASTVRLVNFDILKLRQISVRLAASEKVRATRQICFPSQVQHYRGSGGEGEEREIYGGSNVGTRKAMST